MYSVFALALVLVYFVLAGPYESWILPFAAPLAVPPALHGATQGLGVASHLCTQIDLILLIALASKNAILKSHTRNGRVASSSRRERRSGASANIQMTSFAFIFGAAPGENAPRLKREKNECVGF